MKIFTDSLCQSSHRGCFINQYNYFFFHFKWLKCQIFDVNWFCQLKRLIRKIFHLVTNKYLMFGPFSSLNWLIWRGKKHGQCWISEFYSNFIVCISGNKILDILFQILESFMWYYNFLLDLLHVSISLEITFMGVRITGIERIFKIIIDNSI